MRFLESALAVIGTTLGVAIIAAAATLIQTYNAGVAKELSSPIYRFIQVQPRESQRPDTAPATRFEQPGDQRMDLQISDVAAIKAETPGADYAFASAHELAGSGGKGEFMISVSKGAPPAGGAKGGATTAAAGALGKDNATMTFQSAAGPGGPDGPQMMTLEPATEGPALSETITPLVDEFVLERMTEEGFPAYGAQPARGSLFTAQDQSRGTPVLVLGAGLAKRMFGDKDPVGGRFKKGSTVWTVIGVLAPTPYTGPEKSNPNEWAFAPFQQPVIKLPDGTSMRLPDRVRSLTVAVSDPAKLRAALAGATSYIQRQFGEGVYSVRSNLLEAEQSRTNHNRLFLVIGFLAAAALLISSITLLNLMTTRILRRSRSIGIFRSLGANGGDIFALFLGESLVLTLLGGAIGFVLAPFLYQLLLTQLIPASWGVDLGKGFDWLVMAVSLLGAVVLNLLFGLFPALQAARTNVVEAIRAE